MGNVLSEESEPEFLEEGFNLDSPDADKEINYGTAAPVWQNRKEVDENESKDNARKADATGQGSKEDKSSLALTKQSRQDSTNSETSNSTGDSQVKQQRQNSSSSNNAGDAQNLKKMSYLQMAKLGYQELVNAIIRPPRCDYRVRQIIYGSQFLFCHVFVSYLEFRCCFLYFRWCNWIITW